MTKNNRIIQIDITRGIASFLIPMAHVLLIYGSTHTQENSWLGLSVHFFGKWAGIFLLAMGFSFTLSKNITFKSTFYRGIYLMFLGYLMNFLKFIVPLLFGWLPNTFIEAYGWHLPLNFDKMLYLVLTGDILQFAGMSLFFMGIVHKMAIKFSKWIPVFLTVILLILIEFIRGTRINIIGVDYIFDLLWGDQWNVYFPVIPWIGFIFIGMFFGYQYSSLQIKAQSVFKQMLFTGLVLVVIGGVLCYQNYDFHMRDYFHLGIGGFIYLLGFNLISFWFSSFLVLKIKSQKLINFLVYCSKKITSMYIIQWVVICWGMVVFGYHNKTSIEILPLMLLFTVLTIIIQKGIDKLKTII